MIRQSKVTNVSQIPNANVSLKDGDSFPLGLQKCFCPAMETQGMETDQLSSQVRRGPLKDKETLDESSESYPNAPRAGWCELQTLLGVIKSGMCIVLLNPQRLRPLIPKGTP